MRGTQFGFDLRTSTSPPFDTWATWRGTHVPMKRTFADAHGTPRRDTRAASPPTDPRWGPSAVDIAHIAFQRPFQLAFSPRRLLGTDFA